MIGILLHLLVNVERQPKPIAFIMAGAIVGGLLLTKINLAAFVILPLILGACRATGDHAYLRAGHGVVLALGLLMPLVLMAPLIHLDWVIRYCAFAGGTIFAALVIWSSIFIPKILAIKHWGFFVGGFAFVVLFTVGVTMAGGTTPFEIFRVAVLQNIGLVQNWYLPAPVSGGALIVSAISVAYAVYYAFPRTCAAKRKAAMDRVIRLKVGIGLLGCLAIAVGAIFGTPLALTPLIFQFLVPFAWLLMIPDETATQPSTLVRGVLGLMAAFLVLYAFPVHGTQTALASLLPAVMAPVLLTDALRNPDMQRFFEGWLPVGLKKVIWYRAPVPVMAGTLMLGMLGAQTVTELRRYQSLEPFDFPGTSFIRADGDSAQIYRWAVGELAKCPAFYSLPNLPSLYFWTEQSAPTGIINNNTLGLLSAEQQRQVISDLDRHDRLCILMFPAFLKIFDRGQLATRPPLVKYIEENFNEVASKGPFRILHRNGAD